MHLHLDNPSGNTVRPGLRVRLVRRGVATEHKVKRFAGGIVELVGVTDRDAAASLTHAVVEVRREDFCGDGVFLVDLIGKQVVDTADRPLGCIAAFHDNGAQPLADVRTPDGRSVLVPLVPPIVVAIDDRVALAPPPGLFDDDVLLASDGGDIDDGDVDDGDANDGAELGKARPREIA